MRGMEWGREGGKGGEGREGREGGRGEVLQPFNSEQDVKAAEVAVPGEYQIQCPVEASSG